MSSQSTEMQAVVARIEALERKNRTLRIALAALALLGGSTAMLAFTLPQAETVRAERFVLVDAAGQELGGMAVEDGQVAIRVVTPQRPPVPSRGGGTVVAVPAPTMLMIDPQGSLVLEQGGRELFRLGNPRLRFVR